MAKEILGTVISLPAAADLSTHQFKFVVVDANGRAALVVASGGQADGVLQDKPNALGKHGDVMLIGAGGVSKVVAGAVVAAGALVMSDTTGRAITATATNWVLGRALSASGAANEILSVEIGQRGKPATLP
jgi:hypothetical protein